MEMVNYFLIPHNILNKWKNYFSWVLNVQGVNEVRRTEMHTVEPVLSMKLLLKSSNFHIIKSCQN
jgi:hypothetical protein